MDDVTSVKTIFSKRALLVPFISNDPFLLPLRIAKRFVCAAEAVRDIGDHDVGSVDHVLVPARYGVTLRHVFQRRIDRFVISGGVERPVKIRQHQYGTNLRVLLFLFPHDSCRERIKLSVSAEVKTICPFEYQTFDHFVQPRFYCFRLLYFPVSAKSYDQMPFPHIL